MLDMVRARKLRRRLRARCCSAPTAPASSPPARPRSASCRAPIHKPGRVGVISRSGTLTYEAVGQLTALDIGQSTCIGIGGDPVKGLELHRVPGAVRAGRPRHSTRVIMIGEIGGSRRRAGRGRMDQGQHSASRSCGFIAGATAPPGKRMGHAGAIIAGGKGTAAAKHRGPQRAAGIKPWRRRRPTWRRRCRRCSDARAFGARSLSVISLSVFALRAHDLRARN